MAAHSQDTRVYNQAPVGFLNEIRSQRFRTELKLSFVSENLADDHICFIFNHGVSMSSWGEKITLKVIPVNNDTTSIYIYSECSMPTQIIDWGKNKKMVQNIFSHLEKYVNYPNITQPVNSAAVYAETPPPPVKPENAQVSPVMTPDVCKPAKDNDSFFFNAPLDLDYEDFEPIATVAEAHNDVIPYDETHPENSGSLHICPSCKKQVHISDDNFCPLCGNMVI